MISSSQYGTLSRFGPVISVQGRCRPSRGEGEGDLCFRTDGRAGAKRGEGKPLSRGRRVGAGRSVRPSASAKEKAGGRGFGATTRFAATGFVLTKGPGKGPLLPTEFLHCEERRTGKRKDGGREGMQMKAGYGRARVQEMGWMTLGLLGIWGERATEPADGKRHWIGLANGRLQLPATGYLPTLTTKYMYVSNSWSYPTLSCWSRPKRAHHMKPLPPCPYMLAHITSPRGQRARQDLPTHAKRFVLFSWRR